MERIKPNKNKLRVAGAVLAGVGALSLAGCSTQTEQTFNFNISCAESQAPEVEAVLQYPAQVFVSCGGEQPQSVEILNSEEGSNLVVTTTYDKVPLEAQSPSVEAVLSTDDTKPAATILFSPHTTVGTVDITEPTTSNQ